MTDRDEACARFLAAQGHAETPRHPVSGDASNRRYERLGTGAGSVILMDAPPDKGEDVRPFIRIAAHLRTAGLAAPEIRAADEEQGFLLLEDLGDDLFARVLAPLSGAALEEAEMRLYSGAIDVLAALHKVPLPEGVAPYDAAVMTDMAALAFDWYLAGTDGTDPDARAAFHAAMRAELDTLDAPSVLILRDYHAENLLWMPGRTGLARIGLLDFQDAMAGHPAYDLVSLLQDARRDVSPGLETQMIARYCAATGTEAEAFTRAYHLLGLQRNLRITGVFARLCLRDGKRHYPDLIPRVWGHVLKDLARPELAHLAPLVTGVLPEPTAERLQSLKDQCRSKPTA
ncbi:aminoglycoside phosphotransferase [Pseudooceanicola nanhaiensis]|uniref:Aminoglycoside phosphotransferase n=1 Tax=Pseudooceanicola nanhaiensis TaxID=375761 RepID=A0A917T2Y6_9RHOB|nr:phosphotransferase [Pseudooceanicola nanhaiensis]GGM08148.1 aminoglycoside phosphotransferase [Pseudooceanicola nanhaiensis]